MLFQQTWTAEGSFRAAGGLELANDGKQRFIVDHSRAQHSWRVNADVNDSRLDANLRLAAIDNERNVTAQRGQHMLGAGRRKGARPPAW
jgi:hypothetical protein